MLNNQMVNDLNDLPLEEALAEQSLIAGLSQRSFTQFWSNFSLSPLGKSSKIFKLKGDYHDYIIHLKRSSSKHQVLRTDSRVQKPAIRRLVGPNVKTYW